MKRILAVIAVGVMLTGCDRIPQKIGEEVRQVEVGESIVSDGWHEVVYTQESDMNSLDFDENDPELYVNVKDVDTGHVFKVSLGGECGQWPLPRGERFLTRFDRFASKKYPKDITFAPQSGPVSKFLCG